MVKILALLILVSCNNHSYPYGGTDYEIIDDIDGCDNCTALDLSGDTSKIPNVVFSKDLIYLNLKSKNIEKLDSKICQLNRLRVLLLDENENIELPNCLFNMESIEILSISSCNLNHLPEGLNKMRNLKKLAILGNRFSQQELNELKKDLPKTKVVAYLD